MDNKKSLKATPRNEESEARHTMSQSFRSMAHHSIATSGSLSSRSTYRREVSTSLFGRRFRTLSDLGFCLNNPLAEGFYSRVFSGTVTLVIMNQDDTVTVKKKTLAAKVIDADKAPRAIVKKFFLRELAILKKLQHPNIIHIQSIWRMEKKFVIFMRLAERGDLCNFILTYGSIKEPLIKRWSMDLVIALRHIHLMNIAHRDLKCENILITKGYNVKLADFGFACYTHDSNGRPMFAHTDCGSLCYTAPEVLLGLPYNPKIADIWSLGVVIYVMLTGTFPFLAHDVTSLYREQIARDYSFPKRTLSHASPYILSVIKMILEPTYHERLTLEDLARSTWLSTVKSPTGRSTVAKSSTIRKALFPKAVPSSSQTKKNFKLSRTDISGF